MLKNIKITGYRGLADGEVSEMFPFTCIMGKNNTWKSTLLEAMVIVNGGIGWLPRIIKTRGWIGVGGLEVVANAVRIEASCSQPDLADFSASISLALTAVPSQSDLDSADKAGKKQPARVIEATHQSSSGTASARILFAHDGESLNIWNRQTDSKFRTRFVSAKVNHGDTLDSLAAIEISGAAARDELIAFLREMDGDLRDVRAVPLAGQWQVNAIYDSKVVPVDFMGDGFRRCFEIGSDIACSKAGDVLIIEEPEAFLHSEMLKPLVRSLWRAVDRGTQVVVATHSIRFFELSRDAGREEVTRNKQFGLVQTTKNADRLQVKTVEDGVAPFLDLELRRLVGDEPKHTGPL